MTVYIKEARYADAEMLIDHMVNDIELSYGLSIKNGRT